MGFAGDTLTPMGHIEKNPTLTACDSSTLNAISEVINNGNVSIYPNPANDKLTIEISNSIGMVNYQLTDVLGQWVAAGGGQNAKFDISLEGIANGIYMLTIQADNKIIQKKIIKSN
jgi:hypothetical protein